MSLATTAVPSPRRLDFEPDGIPIAVASSLDEASALSSSRALVRFEFELGKGKEVTQILKVEWSDSDGPNNMRYWELPTVLSATVHVAWASVLLAIKVVFSPCFLALLQIFSFSLYILVNIFLPYFLGVTLKDMQDYDFNQSSVLKSTTRWSA
jgi:hypothetical protein